MLPRLPIPEERLIVFDPTGVGMYKALLLNSIALEHEAAGLLPAVQVRLKRGGGGGGLGCEPRLDWAINKDNNRGT